MKAPVVRTIVRIPPTPERFERLCREFTLLRDAARLEGRPWPASLHEWADIIAREDARQGGE